jgi:hypothetical protein
MEQGIRKFALLLLLIHAVSSIQSQSAGDIDTLSQWRVDFDMFNGYGVDYNHFKYFIDGDTLIDSNLYFKIYRSGYSYEWYNGSMSDFYYYDHQFGGVLREQNNSWYSYDLYYGYEILLYDFNAEVGDSVWGIWGGMATISEIDTITIDGEPKRRFHLNGAGWGSGEYMIEDIGATTGLLEPIMFFENTSSMHCFAIDFVPLWINPANYPNCDLSVTIKESEKSEVLSCFPNPFTTCTTIEFELYSRSNIQFTVYNSIGEVVYQHEEQNLAPGYHSITPQLQHLPAGLYYSVLWSENGVSVVKIIKQ